MNQISFPAFVQQGQLSTRAGVNSKGSVGPLLADGPPACAPLERRDRIADFHGCYAGHLRFGYFEDEALYTNFMDAPDWLPEGGACSVDGRRHGGDSCLLLPGNFRPGVWQ